MDRPPPGTPYNNNNSSIVKLHQKKNANMTVIFSKENQKHVLTSKNVCCSKY